MNQEFALGWFLFFSPDVAKISGAVIRRRVKETTQAVAPPPPPVHKEEARLGKTAAVKKVAGNPEGDKSLFISLYQGEWTARAPLP